MQQTKTSLQILALSIWDKPDIVSPRIKSQFLGFNSRSEVFGRG